jgi:enediyne biosynthesis protein E4
MRHVPYVAVLLFLALASALGLRSWQAGRTQPAQPPSLSETTAQADDAPPPVRILFRDLAKTAGIHFQHFHGTTDMHYVPEIMGGGAAWIDYDQDGYLDLFLVQGSKFPPDPNEVPKKPTSRLYRNMGDGTFMDVTEQVGLFVPGFGQGVAVGDYDNDGFPDLFVSCWGHGHLYHNEPIPGGGRRFREVTKEAGIHLEGWCSCCAFGDLHGSGYLDLFVGRYVQMDLKNYPFCGDKTRNPPLRISCGPKEFSGSRSFLYRNNGNGTFTDISAQAGLDKDGKALGVLILDLDDDGKADLFVGNDEVWNSYYKNLGGGKFEPVGIISGLASTWQGKPMGSMGLEADDVTGKGLPDVFISTYYHEGTVLFRNNGHNTFTDVSQSAGMYAASWNRVGWGTCLLDVDRDGKLDIFVANGHVYRNAGEIQEKSENGEAYSYKMPAQLFLGDGKGRFQIVSDAGPYFKEMHVGRGVAMGDYDNDGAMDIAINNCGEDAVLLHNETRTPHHWIRLQLEGGRHLFPDGSNRDAIGAKVTLQVNGQKIVRHVKGGTSYYSSPDRRLLIGLGAATHVDAVEVRWPNAKSTVQQFGTLEADKSYILVEGKGVEAAKCPPLKQIVR